MSTACTVSTTLENKRPSKSNLRTLIAGVDLAFSEIDVPAEARSSIEGVSRALHLTGVFVHTPEPPAPGTVLSLALLSGGKETRQAFGVVRWRSLLPECPGMGIDIATLDILGREPVAAWLRRSLSRPTQASPTALARLGAWISRSLLGGAPLEEPVAR
jgi:hypothetical protein